mgnify:CR=1 FL=1
MNNDTYILGLALSLLSLLMSLALFNIATRLDALEHFSKQHTELIPLGAHANLELSKALAKVQP